MPKSKKPETRQSLHTLFHKSPAAMVVLDCDFLITDVNGRFCALTGRSRRALLGRPASTYMRPHTVGALARAEFEVFLAAGRWEGVWPIIGKHGKAVQCHWVGAAHFIPGYHIFTQIIHKKKH